MTLIRLTFFLSAAALYFGVGASLGALLRDNPWLGRPGIRLRGVLFLSLVFLSASVLFAGLPEWSPWMRAVILTAGLAALWLGKTQPGWVPRQVWRTGFLRLYLAAAMALGAAWAIGLLAYSPAIPPAVIGASSAAAALAAIVAPLRQADRLAS
ncbi:MAG TPA: hypothetical protein VJ123_08410 [Anaerolineales bacterium]|nr:hypothetical protein [Anaerolineales bacterium]